MLPKCWYVTQKMLFNDLSFVVFFITGLPNALGGYDETPELMASHLKVCIPVQPSSQSITNDSQRVCYVVYVLH